MGVNSLLDMTARSLAVYQKALAVTSNNISNANSTSYTRQRVLLGPEASENFGSLSIGMGVKIVDIQRLKNQALDNQIVKYNSSQSFSEKQSTVISQVESLYSEPSELGISNLLSSFLNSWEELTLNPTSAALRTSVVQNAQNLSVKGQSVYEGLEEMRTDLGKEADNTVKDVNNYITQLSTLNKQIYESTIVGNSANDLLDTRDKYIEDLSKLVNINVIMDSDNVANISIGGVYAVGRLSKIEFAAVQENGKLQIKTADGNTALNLSGGELYSLQKSYNTDIKSYQTQLDSVLNSVYDEVNNLHTTGYTTTDPPETGIKFFESYQNGILVLNNDIVDDVNKIAVSADGSDGNNEIASKIASLKTKKLANGLTMSDNYSNLVSSIGYEKVLQDQNAESFDLVLSQLQEQKSNYSGVSLDEEMVDVLKFQRSYDASAKLIRIADELLNTLLNMV
ncbi:MAG: flagellar hook-associated protein FlgK [bacterium]